ncbi:DUF5946 family protein [Petropleomorpha daqingensis]|uniref:Uncharacterized protein n=1 Tax=Petropleomorpha daqingensis TaxID=2026353 RepID=A0A853CHQ6_9ACTN|nr:hypothetical protein [Petropleomorpha daqingensis]
MSAPPSTTVVCPGCGSVLAAGGDDVPAHPGASAPCARLFEVTLRGPREEASADPSAEALVRLADDAYDAQHPDGDDPQRSTAAAERLTARFGRQPGRAPESWQMTVADVAADLDVIDLPALVESWARSVAQDWSA